MILDTDVLVSPGTQFDINMDPASSVNATKDIPRESYLYDAGETFDPTPLYDSEDFKLNNKVGVSLVEGIVSSDIEYQQINGF